MSQILHNNVHMDDNTSAVTLTLYHIIPSFSDPEKRDLLKTLWKKEKMLVSSIFSFFHNVFNPKKNRNSNFGKV